MYFRQRIWWSVIGVRKTIETNERERKKNSHPPTDDIYRFSHITVLELEDDFFCKGSPEKVGQGS